jgi:hypothetical protein
VLSGSDFFNIRIGPFTNPVGTVDVYRTAGGVTQGKIATAPYNSGVAFIDFNDTGLVADGSTPPATAVGLDASVSQWTFSDAGLVGDGVAAPTTATGAAAGNPVGALDMITDGTALYLAVLDNAATASDPVVYGRVLQFYPGTSNWTQIGATFPIASGNGAAGTLAFYDGALSYATYIGVSSGNTSYQASLATPLPAGGIAEVHTTATSFATVSMVVFNGDVYLGYVSLIAGTAAIIAKRTPVNTWSTARTGPATAQYSAYTSLGVFNGTLFAGWTSGDGATAARIESSPDGAVWTLEQTLDVAEAVGQMVVFGGNLYVVLGRNGNTTKSRILMRTPGGVWSVADDPAADYSGSIALVYA